MDKKTEKVLRQRADQALRLLLNIGKNTREFLVEEAARRAAEQVSSGLNFALKIGWATESGGLISLTDDGRLFLGLPIESDLRLKKPATDQDFESLVEQVLGRRRVETDYCLDRLLGDVSLLAKSFGYDVETLPKSYLHNGVARAVSRLAGIRLPGQSPVVKTKPRIEISRHDGREHIQLIY